MCAALEALVLEIRPTCASVAMNDLETPSSSTTRAEILSFSATSSAVRLRVTAMSQ